MSTKKVTKKANVAVAAVRRSASPTADVKWISVKCLVCSQDIWWDRNSRLPAACANHLFDEIIQTVDQYHSENATSEELLRSGRFGGRIFA